MPLPNQWSIKLIDIRDEIQKQVDALLDHSKLMLSDENQVAFPLLMDDVTNIHKSNLLLLDMLTTQLNNEIINEIVAEKNGATRLRTIRHDLRNPINAIYGYAEIVLEDLEKIDAIELTAHLREIVSLTKEIIDNIQKLQLPADKASHDEVLDTYSDLSELDTDFETGVTALEYHLFKEAFSILVVDDSPDNCHILETYLHHGGYINIALAFDGAQALQKLEKEEFDLLLLDIGMPGMSGIDVLVQLRNRIRQRKLMVLMISGADTIDNAIQCIKLGAEDFLVKPFNKEMLRVRVGACLEKKWFINQEALYQKQIKAEKQRYEELLKAVFPPTIVKELSETGEVKARNYTNIAVLFIDVVGFTTYCSHEEPDRVVQQLQELTTLCETVACQYSLQKIKTIGDAFMAVAGMLTFTDNPALDCLNCAQEIISRNSALATGWQLHAGINYGSVMGGIIGHQQYLFDVWGDTVNTAARIQAFAKADKICLSQSAWEKVRDLCPCRSLGQIELKGKKSMEIFEYEG
ncbi:MAG: adenylate/guanylate cyclase domain-containing protein [Chlamydiales bacterium]